MAAAIHLPRPVPTQYESIRENSIVFKMASCVPFLGLIPSQICQLTLMGKIDRTRDVPRLVQLIDVKNHYKIATMTRNLLTLVLVVASIASGFFTMGWGIIFSG